ncbi:alpha/beta hydrolase [Streptomyces sp. RY43-2]|uniref:Alpha/beta hydrolase n=1 Tax=Streptomyces macrolidinus TaxID=2952607 RepID=A0ABT0ZF35_9ACTN|nr:alpha/beta hydrolase [Streptomyces macrolidinus]MCN9242185.1 alpha/beta hydrolase [Streptomyces macrolidinus]
MPYFESPTDGTRLHFVDYGPADGPVMVFVNSAYFSTEMWEYQTLPLAAEGYRCVGLDRRGHGRSDDVWGGFDLDTLADDVQGLIEHLDLRDLTFVAHSVGTAETVRCLTRHGSARVARVVLVGGMVPGVVRSERNPDGWAPEAAQAGNAAFQHDRAAFFADGARDFFALDRPGNELSDAYVQYMVRLCHASTARAGTALGQVIAALDVSEELTAIDLPVLVVHGTHDTSAPFELTGSRSAALLPNSVLKVYENAGHGLFATHAKQLNADLRKFMAEA